MSKCIFDEYPNYIKSEAEIFNELPMKCQEIYWGFCSMSIGNNRDANLAFFDIAGFDFLNDCKSPIEKIFYLAYELYRCDKGYPVRFLLPQEEISIDGKRYIADFVFDSTQAEEDYLTDEEHAFKLIIECDGHDFHKLTKQQVKHDNERDLALKKAGYDIIHFSGSQIYNSPFECAMEVANYIDMKMDKYWRR